MTQTTHTNTTAFTTYENAERNRVWVYWFEGRPEFAPGYWNIETEGIDNASGREWCKKMNAWVDALEKIGCSHENIETAIRYTMVDGLGFHIVEDFDPKYAAEETTTTKTITTDTITNESAKELYSLRRGSAWSWYELANRYHITEAEAREAYAIIKSGEYIPEGKPALTPINPANEREIGMMLGKAACAWANLATHDDALHPAVHKVMSGAEYEATARCIAMFVREPLWKVCSTIIETAKANFGIEHVN